jgi:hypothetical protein
MDQRQPDVVKRPSILGIVSKNIRQVVVLGKDMHSNGR